MIPDSEETVAGVNAAIENNTFLVNAKKYGLYVFLWIFAAIYVTATLNIFVIVPFFLVSEWVLQHLIDKEIERTEPHSVQFHTLILMNLLAFPICGVLCVMICCFFPDLLAIAATISAFLIVIGLPAVKRIDKILLAWRHSWNGTKGPLELM